MASKLNRETFVMGSRFLRRYTFLLNKYLHGWANSSVRDLVADLQKQFGCLTVALISSEQMKGYVTVLCYPETERETMSAILDLREVQQAIHRVVKDDATTGLSIFVQMSNQYGVNTHSEIDIIPVLWRASSAMPEIRPMLFCLVDPVHLPPISNRQADRAYQREMIAHFLWTWWNRFCILRANIASDSSEGPAADAASHRAGIADTLYSAPISELIRRATRGSRRIRTTPWSGSVECFFSFERPGSMFDWDRWFPAITPTGFGVESANDLRDQARSALYWCRWVGSHRDLETEQDTYTSSQKNAPTSYQLTDEGIRISVADWVTRQRLGVSRLRTYPKIALALVPEGENRPRDGGSKRTTGPSFITFDIFRIGS